MIVIHVLIRSSFTFLKSKSVLIVKFIVTPTLYERILIPSSQNLTTSNEGITLYYSQEGTSSINF